MIPEGGGEAAALLGCIRLVDWLAQPQVLGPDPLTLVLDCGTGTTATGWCCFVPVKVVHKSIGDSAPFSVLAGTIWLRSVRPSHFGPVA